jgi:hypothetical protein
MYLYLDERGDLGFDVSKKGSSRKFVITLLVCYTQQAQKEIKKAIQRTLKNKINKNKSPRKQKELKGTNTSFFVKQYFLRQIRSEEWGLYSVILNKESVLPEYYPAKGQNRLYNFLTRFLIEKLPLQRVHANVRLFVDRSKNTEGILEFNRYLQTHIEGRLPLNAGFKVEHLDSREDAGLQAVDLFCWGIGRKYEYQDELWYNLFQEKICYEVEYSPSV